MEINRPGLNKIRQMAAANLFDVLVVSEQNRLSRNMAQHLMLEEELNQHKILVECVSAGYDDTSERGLQERINALILDYERKKLIKRLSYGKFNKVSIGKTSRNQ